MSGDYLYWFDELSEDHIPIVGRKCAGLGMMRRLNVPVPSGFALTLDAYTRFMEESEALVEIREYLSKFKERLKTIDEFQEASEYIRSLIDSKKMSRSLANEVLSAYDALCKEGEVVSVPVSVRSAGPKSHPGQYETYLNVQGHADLQNKIVKVWSSTFVPRAIAARAREGLPIETDPIGVAVVKMVKARAAGVCFTAEPVTGNLSEIIIEASWGLGESVVGGATNPDTFVVDKNSLVIKRRVIGHKPIKVVCSEQGTVEEETSAVEADEPCITDEEVIRIAGLARDLEQQLGKPQDTEWAVDIDGSCPENVFFLQTRPIVMAKVVNTVDKILDGMVNLVRGV
jgi:pyruvate,water dikinase